MTKQEKLDYINEKIRWINRETKPIFTDGNDDAIILEIETWRAVANWVRQEASETAKKRNLKRLKEYGENSIKPQPRLIDGHKPKSKGKRPKTRDEKLNESLSRLGLNPSEFVKKLKG